MFSVTQYVISEKTNILWWYLFRSSRPEVFCKKDFLKNFTKFTGKPLCQSLFFNKVVALRPANLLKKRLWHRCFPVNFAKFLRTVFLTEYLSRLLLSFGNIRVREDPYSGIFYALYCGTNLVQILHSNCSPFVKQNNKKHEKLYLSLP